MSIKFGLGHEPRDFFLCDYVAILPFAPRIEAPKEIHGDEVTFVVRVVRESPERKCVAVEIFGVAKQSQDKVSAPHIVCQVAEEMTSVRDALMSWMMAPP